MRAASPRDKGRTAEKMLGVVASNQKTITKESEKVIWELLFK
jgi:hypothetical protein